MDEHMTEPLIDSSKVHEAFMDCLFRDEEDHTAVFVLDGFEGEVDVMDAPVRRRMGRLEHHRALEPPVPQRQGGHWLWRLCKHQGPRGPLRHREQHVLPEQ